jgi:sarcosine oxidase gamma subunit
LQALSPFAGLLKPGRYGAHLNPAGVTLRERAGLALFVISVGAGKASEAAAKVVAVTGLELPMEPKRVSKDGFALIGTAPGQWLAVIEGNAALGILAKLAAGLKGLATSSSSDGKPATHLRCKRAIPSPRAARSIFIEAFKTGSASDARRVDRLRHLAGRGTTSTLLYQRKRSELLLLAHGVRRRMVTGGLVWTCSRRDRGRVSALMREFPPRRTVCLTEETVETLYLLGEQDRIVGVSGYAVRPPQVRREKPRVSAFTSADIPKVLALEPDLVLTFSDLQAQIAAELIEKGVAVHAFNQRDIAGILA